MTWRVRQARSDEWQQAKALRLEMLADTPIAFGWTLERAQGLTDDEWRASAARIDQDGLHHVVAVDETDRWLGQAIGLDRGPVTPDQPEKPSIVGVYLTPAARGQGALAALYDEVLAWFRARGWQQVFLEVHEDNARAARAYQKLGWRFTGATRPYDIDPSRLELEMVRDLEA